MNYLFLIIFITSNVGATANTSKINGDIRPIIADKVLSDSQMVNEIQVDFNLVLNGKKPKFAKHKSSLLDGGTAFYKGKGYLLTVVKSMGSIGGVDGYYYGPIIKFKDDENIKTMSNVTFYSKNKLKELLDK